MRKMKGQSTYIVCDIFNAICDFMEMENRYKFDYENFEDVFYNYANILEFKGSSIFVKNHLRSDIEIQLLADRIIVKNIKENTFDTEVRLNKIHKDEVDYDNLISRMHLIQENLEYREKRKI